MLALSNALRGGAIACAAATACFALGGCESSESDGLANAQACLDSATPATASTCAAMVSGDNSSAAYSIRCSAHYITQGFTSTRFAGAFQQITGSTSASPFSAALGYLAFPSTSGNDGSDQTLADCSQSGMPSLEQIALLTSTITLVASETSQVPAAGADGSITPAQIAAAAQYFTGSTTTLGTLATQANSTFCGTGSSYLGTPVCTTLASAIASGGATGTASAIGLALLNTLKQQ
jgi:hypothetical protein